MCRNAQGPNTLSALWFLSVGRWLNVLHHSTVLYFFALLFCVLNTQLKTLIWGTGGPFCPLLTTDTGRSVEENCSGFQYLGLAIFFQAVPLLDFLFHFPFWKSTYVTAQRLLSIIIYHNLEMNSKYRLNIFQLSVNDNLE